MEDYIKKTIEFYDENAEEYIKRTRNLQDTDWIKKFISMLPKGSRVLDLGCASGRDSKTLADYGFEVHGVDLSEKMIERAKKLVKNVKFHVMNLLNLEFLDEFFDGIWCSATLLHISKQDMPKALDEIHRILKKDSILYLNLKEGKGEGVIEDKRYDNAKKFYSFFKEKEIKDLLIKHKFKIIELKLVLRKKNKKIKYVDTKLIFLIAKKI